MQLWNSGRRRDGEDERQREKAGELHFDFSFLFARDGDR